MNYAEQKLFFSQSRMWGGAFAASLPAIVVICLKIGPPPSWRVLAAAGIVAIAIIVSLYYTPNYLHLTVNPLKRARWIVRIRWRICAAVLLIGLSLISDLDNTLIVAAAVLWIAAANWAAKKWVRPGYVSAYFWLADLLVLAVLFQDKGGNPLILALLLGAAALLSIVTCERNIFQWAGITVFSGSLLILFSNARRGIDAQTSWALIGLLVVTAFESAWLIHRAQRHNRKNIDAATRELTDFTGYSASRVRELWATSDQALAANWQKAGLAENDPAKLAEWYKENSELYMFAISGYNLEYKRILSNLRVLRFVRGSCLDYGAGNGELVLEEARRGLPTTYYDVEGQTMRFARRRAQSQGLTVVFFHEKDELAAAARKHGFDTIFSFDVLEHLPDLPGELSFLTSLLNPGGLFVFDVPAGSTKNHPMHLNHNLDVLEYLRQKGLRDERSLWQRMPFRKEEKYLFRAPG